MACPVVAEIPGQVYWLVRAWNGLSPSQSEAFGLRGACSRFPCAFALR